MPVSPASSASRAAWRRTMSKSSGHGRRLTARGSTLSGRLPTGCVLPLTIRSRVKAARTVVTGCGTDAASQVAASICNVAVKLSRPGGVTGRMSGLQHRLPDQIIGQEPSPQFLSGSSAQCSFATWAPP